VASNTAARAGAYAQRLVENEYVQENLAQAADSMRAAYRRASKRRVEPSRDKKLRRHVRQAGLSLAEAANALKQGRRKPKRRRGRRMIVILALTAGGAAAVLAANEELRKKVLGAVSTPESDHPHAPASPEASAAA